MKIVYELESDNEYIYNIQNATLNTVEFGLMQDFGLFGSTEWWANIANTKIAIVTISGMIINLPMTGMGNNWPEVEMLSNNVKTSWTRYASNVKSDGTKKDENFRYYRIGLGIKIEYVVQKFKRVILSETTKCPIRISLYNTAAQQGDAPEPASPAR